MAYVQLQELKHHLRVEVSEDDTYLEHLIDVAETAIANELGKPLEYYQDGETLPKPLLQAIMIECGDLYNNRESVAFATPHEVPRTLTYLLQPYKKYDAGLTTDEDGEVAP